MTRRLLLTFFASISLVLLGFLVPLWIAVGNLALAQAQGTAIRTAQTIVDQLPQVSAPKRAEYVDGRNADGLVTVYLADGTVLGTPVPAGSEVRLAERGSFFAEGPDGTALYAPILDMPGGTAVVRRLIPRAEVDEPVARARLALVALGVLLLGVSGFVTWRLARSFLRPIEDVADTAERLGSGDLSARVTPSGPAEIREIGTRLNRLADRIQELLRNEREDVADLAHRLRTPVTALRLEAESISDPGERERITASADRMALLVDDVIHEARRTVREGAGASCDAVGVVTARAEFWRVLAEDQERGFRCEAHDQPLLVRATPIDLADALDALIGNVFSHTEEGVPLEVSVLPRWGGGATVVVADGGPGFEGSAVERGTSGGGSTGLGLDIARRTAERSGGSLTIGAPGGEGGRVTLELGPPE